MFSYVVIGYSYADKIKYRPNFPWLLIFLEDLKPKPTFILVQQFFFF